MPDTRRELAALQALHADNVAGDISAQDNRDGWQSAHPDRVIQSAAYASIPAASRVTGDLFLPTDGFQVERFDGSNFQAWAPIFPVTKPVSGDFAWINQGSATVDTTNGGIVIADMTANAGSYDLAIRKKAAPATPYTITALVIPHVDGGGTGLCGLLFRQSSDGKLHSCEIAHSTSANQNSMNSRKWTNPTTYSADYETNAGSGRIEGPTWLRIADDGVNRICSFSKNGVTWIPFHSVGRTDFLTADEVGFYVTSYDRVVAMTLLSWKQA